MGILPVTKVRMPAKPRSHYSACGEDSTYANTYSGVGLRPWSRLPKLVLEDKEKCLDRITLPAYGEADTKALQNGHPLFLNELWELEMYLIYASRHVMTYDPKNPFVLLFNPKSLSPDLS